MGNVYIQKRGKVYQYQFAIAPVNGKRKYINKYRIYVLKNVLKIYEYQQNKKNYSEQTVW